MADIMQHTNVGVIEAGNSFCFSLKPLLGGGVGGDITGKILMATILSSLRSLAR
jgi:hypothetical protein